MHTNHGFILTYMKPWFSKRIQTMVSF